MCELSIKVNKAIEHLRMFEPDTEPYFLCFSGGKDSDCIRILAELSGVKYEIHHNLTTMDAPETVKYVKSIPNIIIDKARYNDGSVKTIWNLIPKKLIPPTRLQRYCCSELKENGGKFRLKITGVRWSESASRSANHGGISIQGKPNKTKKFFDENSIEYKQNPKGGFILNLDNDENRRAVEFCYRTTTTLINPIIDWSDNDVWDFLNYYGCKSNPLYHCGFSRIGCIGCPLGGYKNMKTEFRLYPKYKDNFIRTFDKMIIARVNNNKPLNDKWSSGESVFNWWLNLDDRQLLFDGFDLIDV